MSTAVATRTAWPATSAATVFDYCFTVWPDEDSPRIRSAPAVFDLFKSMLGRVVMEFTETRFNDFREDLAKVGLTLREIERQPHLDPMPVS